MYDPHGDQKHIINFVWPYYYLSICLFTEVTEVLQATASPEQQVSQRNHTKFITATTAPSVFHPKAITFHPKC